MSEQVGSYLAFTDFLKQFYPSIVKSYTPTGQKVIAVFTDGILDDTFILRPLDSSDSPPSNSPPSNLPVLIGLSPEDTLYLKKIVVASPAADPAVSANPNAKVVFHRGVLGLDELVFVEADDAVLKNAADIFLGRKRFLEKTIDALLKTHQTDSLSNDLIKYYLRVAEMLSDISLNDAQSNKILSRFDTEREFVQSKLNMVKQQIELLKNNKKRLSLLNNEPAGDPDLDDTAARPVKIIEQILRRLDQTREGFLRTIEERKTKQMDMNSIKHMFENNAKIRDDIHGHHLNTMNAIGQIKSEASFGYNVMRTEMINDVKTLLDKFDTLRIICRDYPSHFNKTDCTRLEQYLQDYKIDILKNLNEQLSKLNTKKEELDNTRESRRAKIQDEIQYIKEILRQKIKEIETMIDLNNSKINTYSSEITKDKLYNYANCSGVLKYYKQVRGILQRTGMIFDKCRDLLDVICTDKSAVRRDLISTLSSEQKEERCATLDHLSKSLNVLTPGTDIVIEGDIDIDTCTKMSDYLLVWIEHSPKLRDIHDRVTELLSNLH